MSPETPLAHMRPLSELLRDLCEVAMLTITKPHMFMVNRRTVERLKPEIEAAIRKPSGNGERCIDDSAAVLVTALLHVEPGADPKWISLAAFLYGYLLKDMRHAFDSEMRPPRDEVWR